MIIHETPDNWVILKMTTEDGNQYYKVYGTWKGGYLDGDSWRLNSGIKEVKQDDNFYYFIGFSGSCYKCGKTRYGVATNYLDDVLKAIKSKGNIVLMDDRTDWSNIITKN